MTAPTAAREFARTFAAPLEIRASSKGGDGRTVEGICVPWDTPMRIDDELTEEFASGCVDHQMRAVNRIRFKRQHWRLIGSCVELRNDAAGLFGVFRVARTAEGDDTLALIEAGALTDLSVGFRARRDEWTERDGERVLRRITVDLREVSAVEEGAYQEHATISGTRARVTESGLVVLDGLAIGQAAPPATAERAEAEQPAGDGNSRTGPEGEQAAGETEAPAGETSAREQITTPRLARAAALLASMSTAAHLSADRAA